MRRWFARAVVVAGCLGAGCLGLGSSLQAQQAAMTEVYGEAVHQYYAGNYSQAEILLNQVQASGSEDPRVHYFLGMCKVAQGGGPMAGIADFEAGAQAEVRSKNSYQVGQALIRIQGPARREIEKARLAARAQYSQQQLLEQRAKADAAAAGVPPTMPSGNTPPRGGDVPDPITEGLRSDNSAIDPVQPTAPDVSDPFGDDPAVPANNQPNAPATDTPITPADGTDPFGTPANEPVMDDPFGTGH